MQLAIVGLRGAGKTTVFNALTGGHAPIGGYGGPELHLGVVKVPDPRLERLAEMFRPRKIVPAEITFADLPAPPASTDERIGTEAMAGEHLGRLRDADALVHVVRAFEDPAVAHPDGPVDPGRDLEHLELEFALTDLSMIDRRLERLGTSGRHGTPAEREANEREEALLRRLQAHLAAEQPLRDAGLSLDDERTIRGFRFLTQKPVLIVLNVGEDQIPHAGALAVELAGRYAHEHALVEALAARLEVEIGQLEPDEATQFRAELGLSGTGPGRVIELSYRLLGLISFLTAGPDEVRAWPVRDGVSAVEAAAAIHSDLARGFIRAETVAYEELIAFGSLAEARRAGRLRSEGRTYRVRDGDVIEILFSR